MKPPILLLLGLLLISISVLWSQTRIATLERQNKELTEQVTDIGDELDNVERQLHIDKESVQN